VIERIVGDTRSICGCSFVDKRRTIPRDWTTSGYTPKISIETATGTESLAFTSVTPHPTQVVTLDSTNNWIKCDGHGYEAGNQLVFSTSGSLSGTGLTIATKYLVVETDDNWFRVSVRNQGLYVTIAGAGSGTHLVYRVGSWEATNAQTSVSALAVGEYYVHVGAFNAATQIEVAPNKKDGFGLRILPKGN
jgi:hypothetical protein